MTDRPFPDNRIALRLAANRATEAEAAARAARHDVGQTVACVMNDVTTGDGWHAVDSGAVLFAPGCELCVVTANGDHDGTLRIEVVRRTGPTTMQCLCTDPANLLPLLRRCVNEITSGQAYAPYVGHDQPWLSAFAFWLNSYVDQIEGKNRVVFPVTP